MRAIGTRCSPSASARSTQRACDVVPPTSCTTGLGRLGHHPGEQQPHRMEVLQHPARRDPLEVLGLDIDEGDLATTCCPVSSKVSRTTVSRGSSPWSTPPPGRVQPPGQPVRSDSWVSRIRGPSTTMTYAASRCRRTGSAASLTPPPRLGSPPPGRTPHRPGARRTASPGPAATSRLCAEIRCRRSESTTSRTIASTMPSSLSASRPSTPSCHELPYPTVGPADDRQPGRARLDGRDAERLEPGRRDVQVRAFDRSRPAAPARPVRSARPNRVRAARPAGASAAPPRPRRGSSAAARSSLAPAPGPQSPCAATGSAVCGARDAWPRRDVRRRRRAPGDRPSTPPTSTPFGRTVTSAPAPKHRPDRLRRKVAHGREGHRPGRPVAQPLPPPARPFGPAEHAVPGHDDRQPQVEHHLHRVVREGRHDPGVDVHHVVPAGEQDGPHIARCERVDRQLERQPDRQPVHRHPVDDIHDAMPLAVRARRRRQHADLMSGRLLPAGQTVDLRLDATQPGQVAVGQMGHAHGPILALRARSAESPSPPDRQG